MPFRFFRRVKIAPGVTLNLSKGGLSLSGGIPGAKITVGRTGVRQTLGLTGTGLHWTKHSGWKGAGSSDDRIPIALGDLTNDQLRDVVDSSYIVYSNPSTNRRYTQNQISKEIERREFEGRRSSSEETVARAEAKYREIVNHWKCLPVIPELEEFHEFAESISFNAPTGPEPPNTELIKRQFERDLTKEIYKKFPYTLMPVSFAKKKAAEELNERWPEQARQIQLSYDKLLHEHRGEVEALRARHEAKESLRVAPLLKILADDPFATNDLACSVFENIDWPFETSAMIGTNDGVHLFINLDLPEIEDVIPDQIAKVGRAGDVIETRRTKKEQNEDYFDVVVGQSVYLAASQFAWNPTLKSISIAAYTQRSSSRAEVPTDHYVYSAIFTQEKIRNFKPELQGLQSFFAEIGAEVSVTHNGSLRRIAPPRWALELFKS